jgi:hypothetical protein
LGVTLRVGLYAAILCLSGQSISAAIPNAEKLKAVFQFILKNGFGAESNALLKQNRLTVLMAVFTANYSEFLNN